MTLDVARRDTICAAATAIFPSAIAIIRVSGPDAFLILNHVFVPYKTPQKPFVATLGCIGDFDEGICTFFPNKKSYTGEPSFELSLHGNPILVQSTLALLQDSGCRLAEPGEFSMRAVLSGKMDLCEAESVADLIAARSVQAAQMALRNIRGGLGEILDPVRSIIIDALCEIEARLDFPDENIGEHIREQLKQSIGDAILTLERLLGSAKMGTRLIEGARMVLFGKPNAGKSTLLNALLEEDRALVHHMPGTTRDVLEANFTIQGIPVTIIDVAGIRDEAEADTVEAMGIQKAMRELEHANIILWLQDGTTEIETKLPAELIELDTPILSVVTKADLIPPQQSGVQISALTREGLDELIKQIAKLLVDEQSVNHEAMITRERQKHEVGKALSALCEASNALSDDKEDVIVASELRLAGAALDRLLGKTLGEDVLDLIFSRFCIGK